MDFRFRDRAHGRRESLVGMGMSVALIYELILNESENCQ